MRALFLISCLLMSGCVGTTIAGVRAGIDIINLVTKEPPVIINSLECSGKVQPISPSKDDIVTKGTRDQIVDQAILLKKLCGESED